MRLSLFVILLIFGFCEIACKKHSDLNLLDVIGSDSLGQSIVYNTIATIPSPADTFKGLLKDSISVFRRINRNNPNFGTNIPYVSSNLSNNSNGFSFGYIDPSKPFPYFGFTAYAFPDVPRHFILNKAYEHTSIRGSIYQSPLFLGSHSGNGGMTYFVNNVYPPDAGFPSTKTYTSITFNKRIKFPLPPNARDTAIYGSGHISGYCIKYFHNTDTTKYVQRWDFTVAFTDLRIDP